ncbi:unnamed protein product, partial [Porites lobata]
MNRRWSTKLDEKTKQLESKSKLDKQVTQMKFKGNQKQFELNAQIDSVLDRIRSANDSKNNQVDDLVDEGKELILKRQKLIRIADKSADGWKVVDEYVSYELASGLEDEKRLKKAKEAASRKRRQPTQVLLFGLSSAPHVFTKVLKPLEKHWRQQGICVAVFLDEGWGGFRTNEDKSVWTPCQRLDWLGITRDSARG